MQRGVRLVFESGRPIAHVAGDLGVSSGGVAQACASRRGRRRQAQGLRRMSVRSSRAASRGVRAAAGELDPQGGVGLFCEGARPEPTEVSRFIDSRVIRFGVEPVCRTLDVGVRAETGCRTLGTSASAYYKRATGARSARAVEDERLLGLIRQVHRENYECYGQERVWRELGAEVWTSAATGWRA